jgi:cytosine/adenosine deaminase-related metal-dependent hydrolase
MRPSYQALALGFASYVYNVANAASILFTDTTIVQFNTTNSRIEILYNSSLLVEGDRISEIYNGTTPGSYPSGTEVVNATGKIISPGFIDTHRHLWQTAFKTIASNTSLAEYFQRYSEYSPTIQYMTPEDKYLSQLTGCLESLNAGTTTVLDHAHGNSNNATADAIFNATLDSQLRTYHAFAIHQLPNDYSMEDQINKLVSLAHDPRLATNSLVNIGLAFDSFDASSSSLVDQLWKTVQCEIFLFIS